jgi:hypothetical protein
VCLELGCLLGRVIAMSPMFRITFTLSECRVRWISLGWCDGIIVHVKLPVADKFVFCL